MASPPPCARPRVAMRAHPLPPVVLDLDGRSCAEKVFAGPRLVRLAMVGGSLCPRGDLNRSKPRKNSIRGSFRPGLGGFRTRVVKGFAVDVLPAPTVVHRKGLPGLTRGHTSG